MSNVIRLHNGPYVELDGGVVTAGPNAGLSWYFVSLVDKDGGLACTWDGPSYDEACAVLAEYRKEGERTVNLLWEWRA